MKFLLLLALFFVGSNGQIVTSGPCPDVDVVDDFDLAAYLGVWYEVERYENTFQFGGDCVTATYSERANMSGIGVRNRQVRSNGTEYALDGFAVVDPIAAPGEAKLLVNFPTSSNESGMYWVLDTDYTDYSLVYSCTPLPGNNRGVFSWILSRTPTFRPQAVMAVNKIIAEVETLSWSNYRMTNQSETSCRVL